MRLWFIAAFLLGAAQLGCASAPPADERECAFSGRGAFVLWLEPLDLEPGASTPLSVMWRDGFNGFTRVPAHCVTRWQIADTRVAALSRDRTALIVRTDAVSDATTQVTARIGDRSVTGLVRVFRRADRPLIGLWRQMEAECVTGRAIAELVFKADGGFSVTWIPFETYKDYWGRWDYDAATGALELSVENGNYMPADVHSGQVALSGDTLQLVSASFGSPPHGERCEAPFHRAR